MACKQNKTGDHSNRLPSSGVISMAADFVADGVLVGVGRLRVDNCGVGGSMFTSGMPNPTSDHYATGKVSTTVLRKLE